MTPPNRSADDAVVIEPTDAVDTSEVGGPLEVVEGPEGGGGAPSRPVPGPVAYWRRIVARVLDVLVIFWLQLAFTVVGLFWFVNDASQSVDPRPWGNDFVPLIIFIVMSIGYEVLFITKRGQTPGKDVMKIRVARVADGENPTVVQALVRSSVTAVFRLVPGAIMLVGNLVAVLAGATAPFTLRRRALHDLAAGTMVVFYDANLVEGPVPKVNRPSLTDALTAKTRAVAGEREGQDKD